MKRRGRLRRRCAQFPGDLRIARDVLPRLRNRIFDDERRDGNSNESHVCRDRVGHEHARERRHAAESSLLDVRAEAGGFAERRYGAQGIERHGQRVDAAARWFDRAGLHRSGAVRSAGCGSTDRADFWPGDQRRATADFVSADLRADARKPRRQKRLDGTHRRARVAGERERGR